MLGSTNDAGIINAEVAATLNYLNHFWRTIEMSLIIPEINSFLTWSFNFRKN